MMLYRLSSRRCKRRRSSSCAFLKRDISIVGANCFHQAGRASPMIASRTSSPASLRRRAARASADIAVLRESQYSHARTLVPVRIDNSAAVFLGQSACAARITATVSRKALRSLPQSVAVIEFASASAEWDAGTMMKALSNSAMIEHDDVASRLAGARSIVFERCLHATVHSFAV